MAKTVININKNESSSALENAAEDIPNLLQWVQGMQQNQLALQHAKASEERDAVSFNMQKLELEYNKKIRDQKELSKNALKSSVQSGYDYEGLADSSNWVAHRDSDGSVVRGSSLASPLPSSESRWEDYETKMKSGDVVPERAVFDEYQTSRDAAYLSKKIGIFNTIYNEMRRDPSKKGWSEKDIHRYMEKNYGAAELYSQWETVAAQGAPLMAMHYAPAGQKKDWLSKDPTEAFLTGWATDKTFDDETGEPDGWELSNWGKAATLFGGFKALKYGGKAAKGIWGWLNKGKDIPKTAARARAGSGAAGGGKPSAGTTPKYGKPFGPGGNVPKEARINNTNRTIYVNDGKGLNIPVKPGQVIPGSYKIPKITLNKNGKPNKKSMEAIKKWLENEKKRTVQNTGKYHMPGGGPQSGGIIPRARYSGAPIGQRGPASGRLGGRTTTGGTGGPTPISPKFKGETVGWHRPGHAIGPEDLKRYGSTVAPKVNPIKAFIDKVVQGRPTGAKMPKSQSAKELQRKAKNVAKQVYGTVSPVGKEVLKEPTTMGKASRFLRGMAPYAAPTVGAAIGEQMSGEEGKLPGQTLGTAYMAKKVAPEAAKNISKNFLGFVAQRFPSIAAKAGSMAMADSPYLPIGDMFALGFTALEIKALWQEFQASNANVGSPTNATDKGGNSGKSYREYQQQHILDSF